MPSAAHIRTRRIMDADMRRDMATFDPEWSQRRKMLTILGLGAGSWLLVLLAILALRHFDRPNDRAMFNQQAPSTEQRIDARLAGVD